MLLQTSQTNLHGDKITVNGRPYRVDADGVVDISFDEDAGKLLAMPGWTDKIVRKASAPSVEQGRFRDGKAFLSILALGGDHLTKASKMGSFPGLSSYARGAGYLLSTEEAFRLDVAEWAKANRESAEDLFRSFPKLRPDTSKPAPRAPTPSTGLTPLPPAGAVDEDVDPALHGDGDDNGGSTVDDDKNPLGEESLPPDPTMAMTKAQLQGLATQYQVAFDERTTKRDLVDLVRAVMYPDGLPAHLIGT